MSLVVVDSSVLIPLLRIGKVELLFECFADVIVPDAVWEEVVVVGRELGKVFAAVEENAQRFKIIKTGSEKLPEIKGLQANDLKVLSAAKVLNDTLLTNDAAVYEAAVAQNIKAWWLTALIFYAVKSNVVSSQEGKNILLELVTTGTYLKSEILAHALLTLEKLGKSSKKQQG